MMLQDNGTHKKNNSCNKVTVCSFTKIVIIFDTFDECFNVFQEVYSYLKNSKYGRISLKDIYELAYDKKCLSKYEDRYSNIFWTNLSNASIHCKENKWQLELPEIKK